MLRFPGAGEEHILRTARQWAGEEVASRVYFTDVTKKEAHILRARVADLFLDTTEVCPKASEMTGDKLIHISAMLILSLLSA